MTTPPPTPEATAAAALEAWRGAQHKLGALRRELAKVIVGQDAVVELLLVTLLCRGHALLVGVPGLAKTLLVSTLGQLLGLRFRRIQFTPDLMPMDILGSEILQEDAGVGGRRFEFRPGPVFANLLLADEINRTPPKTQSALLEAMQEKQVTVAGQTHALEEPFVVFATQNPIEHEGTYPLPEAQLDRFFFEIRVDYPSAAEEEQVLRRTIGRAAAPPPALTTAAEVLALQDLVHEVPLPDHVVGYILRLVHATRPTAEKASDYIKKYVAWGAGPRASQTLARAARGLALLRDRSAASVEEVRAVAAPVLRHRVIPNYNATGEGVTPDDIVRHLLDQVPAA